MSQFFMSGVALLLVAMGVQADVTAPPSMAPSQALSLICGEAAEMGTPFKVCVYASESDRMGVQFDIQKAFRKLREINGWMSEWQPGTDLSQVNQAAGARPVRVRRELFELMTYARGVSERTEGAFDPTFNAFWGLYVFKSGQHREPTEEEIRDRLPLIGYRNVVSDVERQTLFLKKPGMKLGFGGLGQGYGVDAAVAELRKRYAAGYVDGSGDTFFWGRKPGGDLWIAAIRDPRDNEKVVARLYGTEFAVTTSGDDEKYFMVGGRRVHHIIDPKTGRPSTASRQCTVVARRALDADAYDTACFVMGPEKSKKVLEGLSFVGVMVTETSVTMTKGLNKKTTPWGEVFEVMAELK